MLFIIKIKKSGNCTC